jgi:hypothetical protein
VMVRARACPLWFEQAGSSPGAPHRGRGLPPSKPGLIAETHDLGSTIRKMHRFREPLSIS